MIETTITYNRKLTQIDWPRHAVFIVDDGLPDTLIADLPEPVISIGGGESIKNLDQIGALAEIVLSLRSTRPLTLVAVGGGAVGDVAGFLASILWRGVTLWHVPTTLVAMVDSAHGGKTAVNLDRRKNQLGTFYPAHKVIICDVFLETLPLDLREEGLVELVKTLWLSGSSALDDFDDADFYHRVLTGPVTANHQRWTDIIDAAITGKTAVVAEDPHEKSGHRRILNLGHTAGHGLEAIYGLPHGRAVAWGLAACAYLSTEFADLSKEDSQRLLSHVDPLLVPLPEFPCSREFDDFIRCLNRDKKHRDGQLISILLDGPGQPVQTTEISPEQWWNAVRKAFTNWQSKTITVESPATPKQRAISLPCGKSEANRAAAIAYLRPGETKLTMSASQPPADVTDMRRALRLLREAGDDAPVVIPAGKGATTGRFLLAIAANRRGPTTFEFAEDLLRRPHEPLLEVLRCNGADVEPTGRGFTVHGWPTFPDRLIVDASTSSQFASALALLSATGESFELVISEKLASKPYFELTLAMLRRSGVIVDSVGDQTFRFSAGLGLDKSLVLQIPPDTSSAVVWCALNLLDRQFPPMPLPDTLHADTVFPDLAQQLTNTAHATIDLSDSPDLAIILATMACLLPVELTIIGAGHLRFKESDRITDLAIAFQEVGLVIETGDDGFTVPAGIQTPEPDAIFDPRGDHRLAMAGLLLSTASRSFSIRDARCVAKSYPDLWRQARRLDFHIIAEA